MNRRSLLTAGLASAAGLAAGKLILPASAQATTAVGELGAYGDFLKSNGLLVATAAHSVVAPIAPALPTEDNIEGPYYRRGAPTRYTITAAYEPGTVMVIRGRVWGFDTKKPIAGAAIHIWQADEKGSYDNDDPRHPPAANLFVNRGIIFSDAQGAYEYQTIHPGRYLNGPQYRPAHIHYMVQAHGYQSLTTQLYFEHDPYNSVDPFIKPSLIIPLQNEQRYGKTFERGVFDIVLTP